MANTYSSLFYHIVFSTKHRQNFIRREIENRVWAYLGRIARKHKLTAIQIGGIENHIQALIVAPTSIAPSQIAQWLKGDSSKWIHAELSDLHDFAWQDGYGAFSVSKSKVADVVEYIRKQREHHKTENFENEYLKFVKLHEIDFDEKFLFD